LKSSPAVSVVIPTFNRAGFLRQAIDSVRAQSFPDWELVVVDDGSTDDTQALLADVAGPRLRVARREPSGAAAAPRNLGIEMARGRWVAFLDSDDRWLAAKLETQLGWLARHPSCRWSYTSYRLTGAGGREIPKPAGPPWEAFSGWILEPLMTTRASVQTSTVCAERSLLVAAGGFDESLRFVEDYDLWFRLARRSPVAAVPEVLTEVREHGARSPVERRSEGGDDVFDSWVRVYRKLAASGSPAGVRALSHRRCVHHRAGQARRHAVAGRYLAALGSALRAAGHGVRWRGWWLASRLRSSS
jgi:glycosyltransferase involved in cell wall biosynthesis